MTILVSDIRTCMTGMETGQFPVIGTVENHLITVLNIYIMEGA